MISFHSPEDAIRLLREKRCQWPYPLWILQSTMPIYEVICAPWKLSVTPALLGSIIWNMCESITTESGAMPCWWSPSLSFTQAMLVYQVFTPNFFNFKNVLYFFFIRLLLHILPIPPLLPLSLLPLVIFLYKVFVFTSL